MNFCCDSVLNWVRSLNHGQRKRKPAPLSNLYLIFLVQVIRYLVSLLLDFGQWSFGWFMLLSLRFNLSFNLPDLRLVNSSKYLLALNLYGNLFFLLFQIKSINNIPIMAIRFLLSCLNIDIVLVSVVGVLHIPVATVSFLLSNVDFKSITPGRVVAIISNPSRTKMYGSVVAARSCNESKQMYFVFHEASRIIDAMARPIRLPCINLNSGELKGRWRGMGGNMCECVPQDKQSLSLYTFPIYIPKRICLNNRLLKEIIN